MEIVDAQIHLWSQGLPSNAAHRQVTAFGAAEAVSMMDEAGIDAAVIHPPSWDPEGEAVALEAVAAHPGRFAVMGALPLEDAGSLARLDTWRARPGMLGLRYVFLREPDRRRLEDGSIDWLWAGAERAGVPVALLATHSFARIGEIAARHPALRLTIDHLGGLGGNTTAKDAAAMTHLPELVSLAKHPNVAVKATGLPGYSSESYPFRSLQEPLRRVFDAFGPERTFWGTDITKMPCSWRECATMFTEALSWLRGEDLRLVMGASLRRWWGWDAAGDRRI